QPLDLLVQDGQGLAPGQVVGVGGGQGLVGRRRGAGRRPRAAGGRRALRAFMATRKATPWSQAASESPRRIDAACRGSTRNVACEASAASARWSRARRQTPSTSPE